MTDRKHLKSRVRARMAHTGERYATARLHVTGTQTSAAAPPGPAPASTSPGVNPGAAALGALLESAGLPIPEPLALVVGGGIGMGVFQFHYAKEATSSFFVAGRHRWEDETAFLVDALRRLHLDPVIHETRSVRVAERELRAALGEGGGPVVAWVDAATLGTRAMPDDLQGGAYHVLVVRAIDDERSVAIVDDLAVAPLAIPLETLAQARARIARDRNRTLRLPLGPAVSDAILPDAIRVGLQATVDGLARPRARSFALDALDDWARRLRGGGTDGWDTVFPPGPRRWDGLAAIRLHIEHYGSGGGLLRPAFAAGLRLAGEVLAAPALDPVADRYDALGRAWSDLATAALPPGVPAFRRTARLQDRRATTYRTRGAEAHLALEEAWRESATIRVEMADCWPLDETATAALQRDLADRVDALATGEREAIRDLATALDGLGPPRTRTRY